MDIKTRRGVKCAMNTKNRREKSTLTANPSHERMLMLVNDPGLRMVAQRDSEPFEGGKATCNRAGYQIHAPTPSKGFFMRRTPDDTKCCPAARKNRAAPASQRESALIQGPTTNRSSTYESKRPHPPSTRGPGNRMNRSNLHQVGFQVRAGPMGN